MHDDLRAIMACDPDGGEREPTDADHAAHERWAREAYGDATWERYKGSAWGESGIDGDQGHLIGDDGDGY